jgi:hypothetical protein
MSDEENVQPEPRRRRREDDFEEEEPRPRRRPRLRREDDDDDDPDRFRRGDGIEVLIPYRNPKALIAYYLGVFALIPCLGLALGPAALVLGVLGLKYRKLNPTAGGTGHAIAGIVLGTLVLLGHLAGIALIVAGIIFK